MLRCYKLPRSHFTARFNYVAILQITSFPLYRPARLCCDVINYLVPTLPPGSIMLRFINYLVPTLLTVITRRHLHQRVEEHKNSSSSIGKHLRDKRSLAPKDLTKNFSVLMKCTNKFDCLVYEMFFIHELRPSFNVQSDSIRSQVFN